ALRLAKEGWDIAIHCRASKHEAQTLVRQIARLGRKAVIVTGDLEDAKVPARLIKEAQKQLGPLTCLINNASQFRKDALYSFTEESLAMHLSVNALAPLRLIKYFAQQCPKEQQSNIVNIGDGLTGWSISPNFLTYSLSKMLLSDLTQLLASD